MKTMLFGQYLLERGLITPAQLTAALEYQRTSNKVLGRLASEYGLLNEQQIRQILGYQLGRDDDFGSIALELGFLAHRELDRLLLLQQDRHVHVGEALVALGAFPEETLEQELKLFQDGRRPPRPGHREPEPECLEHPAAAFFTLASKLLPRMTGGRVLAGGFYPTITLPEFECAFSQRAQGQLPLEAVVMLPAGLLPVLGQSICECDGQRGEEARGRLRHERAVKEFIASAVEIFARKRELAGDRIEPLSRPIRISRRTLLQRRSLAASCSIAEFYLINPPDPSGDFLQLGFCLMLG